MLPQALVALFQPASQVKLLLSLITALACTLLRRWKVPTEKKAGGGGKAKKAKKG